MKTITFDDVEKLYKEVEDAAKKGIALNGIDNNPVKLMLGTMALIRFKQDYELMKKDGFDKYNDQKGLNVMFGTILKIMGRDEYKDYLDFDGVNLGELINDVSDNDDDNDDDKEDCDNCPLYDVCKAKDKDTIDKIA